MNLLFSLVVFVFLSLNALSMPTAPRPHLQGRSFKVDLVQRSNYVPHGPTALRKAYRKFGITSTEFAGTELSDFKLLDTSSLTTVKSALEGSSDSEQSGAVSAASVNGDQEFVSPVSIGGQTLPMNFDSGSADM
jgi:aspergillopepsin I